MFTNRFEERRRIEALPIHGSLSIASRSAIVGRPVFTILDSNAKGQQGTLHFHYLLRQRGGHVELAESFDQHTAQLSDALAGKYRRDAIDEFVQRFVRPHGLNVPVAPRLADAIEALAATHETAIGRETDSVRLKPDTTGVV